MVTPPTHAYTSPAGQYIEIVPAMSKTKFAATLKVKVGGLCPAHRVALVCDADGPGSDAERSLLSAAASVALPPAGGVQVGVVRAPDHSGEDLEGLVLWAIRASSPDHLLDLDEWLSRAPPRHPGAPGKFQTRAWMAKWTSAEEVDSLEELYRALWRDDRVAVRLEEGLRRIGVATALETLL